MTSQDLNAPTAIPVPINQGGTNSTTASAALAALGAAGGGIVSALAQTGNFTMTVPAGAVIDDIFINETAGFAVTGGVKIGTTSGAVDVAIALAVGANSIQIAPSASILKQVFSTTLTQTLFFQAVTLWNGASVNVEIIYRSL